MATGLPALTVLLPGLLGPWPRALHGNVGAGLELPALAALARRGGVVGAPGSSADAPALETLIAATCLGRASPPALDRSGARAAPEPVGFPFASLAYLADGGAAAPEQWVMRVEPVGLAPTARGANLIAGPALALCAAEGEGLAQTVAGYFAEHGLALEVAHPTRWYLRLDDPPRLASHPPSSVAGSDIGRYLPRDDAAPQWRRHFSELQMILHASPINERRERDGLAPVNSVWFWGQGRLADLGPEGCRFDTVWSDDPVARGLAIWGGATGRPGATLEAILEDGAGSQPNAARGRPTGHRHLVVLDDCHGPRLASAVELWRRAVLDCEGQWFAPLLASLDERRVGRLWVQPGLAPFDGERLGSGAGPSPWWQRWWPRQRSIGSASALLWEE